MRHRKLPLLRRNLHRQEHIVRELRKRENHSFRRAVA
jgi:hypothetical protein